MKGVYLTADEELTVVPATAEEIKWINKLQRVLSQCPPRLGLVTIGDPSLSIIDKYGDSELADGAAHRDGVVVADIVGGPAVQGVSG